MAGLSMQTPIDYTLTDFCFTGNGSVRLLNDGPDNTTTLVHLSFADLLLIVSHVTCHNYPPAKSSEALNVRFGQIIGQDNPTTVS